MSDPAIKLFGRTIPLPEGPAGDGGGEAAEAGEKDVGKEEAVNSETKDSSTDIQEELRQRKKDGSSDTNNGNGDDQPTASQVDILMEDPKNEKDQAVTGASGLEKVLKKPDKILLCPRCNSMETKFCYYNNYNVNQPRHFCKNCQRYWTAGGTMRNVPVGAGRRKNKHSASQQRHIMMLSDGVAATRVDVPDSTQSQATSCGNSTAPIPLKVNRTVLKFGAEAPLCESMASVLNLGEKKKAESSPVAGAENMDELSSVSSVTASTPNGIESEAAANVTNMLQNSLQGYCSGVKPMQNLQCYPGPWAYPWRPGWNTLTAMPTGRCSNELANASENSCPNPVPWNPYPLMATAFCPPAIPFSFIPPALWGCMPALSCGTWSVPWIGPNGGLSQQSYTDNSGCSSGSSPTLGKHSRDASFQSEEKAEKSLWVPKTLRIDDPDEAAKSSIWSTLGIKPDEGGTFKAFQSKITSKSQAPDASQVLHANPAALSRSQTFQESN